MLGKKNYFNMSSAEKITQSAKRKREIISARKGDLWHM